MDITSPHERIDQNLTTHPPKDERVGVTFDSTTSLFLTLAHSLEDLIPDSREKSIMNTKIEEASMWAKAAIARNQAGL